MQGLRKGGFPLHILETQRCPFFFKHVLFFVWGIKKKKQICLLRFCTSEAKHEQGKFYDDVSIEISNSIIFTQKKKSLSRLEICVEAIDALNERFD